MLRFCLVPTPWGRFTIIAERSALVATRLPREAEADCLADVCRGFPDAEYDERILPRLRTAMRNYFDGGKPAFAVRLNLDGVTPLPPGALCYGVDGETEDDALVVDVMLGYSVHQVIGGQFLIGYDPDALEFIAARGGF